MKKFILDVVILALAFIIQSVLGNWINLDNLLVDFLSFVIIFVIIRILMSKAYD
ncbi:hypothetical protein QP248_05385 [Aerococcus sp. UMB8608]|uniref:hypothetical protein n=1 Tax=unclassified Aerococcus TaxID=2618060 RepID=UPI00143B434F|nr:MULTISPECIES: hypothetical protein [unclassified Aerococcus]MDK6679891.1 hypothetical protein [Aerococcus sp. UMB8608]MDK6686748.1 hypothetical protein [Aerococcus sp. UMB8623]MDK6939813.1 hypothetical protein [Aerococcus sp. UMB8487]